MIRSSRLRQYGQADYRSRSYQHARAQLLAAATHCYWCNMPGTTDDPLTADHTSQLRDPSIPPLVPAHRSCNSRRGGYQHGTG